MGAGASSLMARLAGRFPCPGGGGDLCGGGVGVGGGCTCLFYFKMELGEEWGRSSWRLGWVLQWSGWGWATEDGPPTPEAKPPTSHGKATHLHTQEKKP